MGGRPCGVLVTVLLLPWVRADLTQDVDEYYTAVINLTYVHPTTGQLVSEREELGRYYSAGKLGSVSGVVVHVTSGNFTAHDACSPLDAASIPQEPWIALIQHGNCVESVKMRHAANTNASGAVLYSGATGPGASGRLLKMRHKGGSRHRSLLCASAHPRPWVAMPFARHAIAHKPLRVGFPAEHCSFSVCQ
uniref:E3 ubiquitin ligase ixodes scapularis e3 ubiquitin ligase n=1 Tax=Rhipicephalus appendiculatus TaxID=34631 RepID=A0A131YQB0_RHIAP